jgi:hypothetical protein
MTREKQPFRLRDIVLRSPQGRTRGLSSRADLPNRRFFFARVTDV